MFKKKNQNYQTDCKLNLVLQYSTYINKGNQKGNNIYWEITKTEAAIVQHESDRTSWEKLEQIIFRHAARQCDAWLSTWFANVFHMKDELWCISAPAAAKSLTAPDQAPPWPSLQEGPPTGRSGAHTGSRTTSAPRRNSARPAQDRGREGVNEREMS